MLCLGHENYHQKYHVKDNFYFFTRLHPIQTDARKSALLLTFCALTPSADPCEAAAPHPHLLDDFHRLL